jgi:hypothetical protein
LNLQSTRPSKKLNYQQLGPFPIIGEANLVEFYLQFMRVMKIHPIFHVLIFEPFHESTILGRHIWLLRLIDLDGKKKFEVNKVLDF